MLFLNGPAFPIGVYFVQALQALLFRVRARIREKARNMLDFGLAAQAIALAA